MRDVLRVIEGGLFSAVLLCAMFVRADGYVKPLEIDLQPGVTNTLAAWLLEAECSLDDYAELVKKGDGCLKIEEAIAFTGDIHVEGGTLWPMKEGALGGDGGRVVVHDGGRLYYDTRSETAVSTPSFYGKRFFIEGDGGDGLGAVLCRCRGNGSARLLGTNLTLTANAKIAVADGRYDLPQALTLDLGGYTLTLANVLGASGKIICYGGSKISNGHIIADKCQFLHQNVSNYVGGPENTISLVNGASLSMYNFMGTVNWGLQTLPGTGVSAITARYPNTASSGQNKWEGPLLLEKNVYLAHTDENSGMILSGKISGPAGFATDGVDARKNFTVSLTNPDNEMTGKSTFDAITLNVPVDGALPDCMQEMECRGTRLVFQTPESNVTYALPPVTFVGAGTVLHGKGTWKNALVKKGEGTLDYMSSIGAELLDVQGGSVRLAHPGPGLHEGVHVDAENGVGSLFNSDYLVTNNVATQLNWAYRCSTKDGWKPRMLATYSGYIWNRSGQTQRWTFAGSVFEGAIVYLDGKKVMQTYAYNGGDWKGANKATVDVKHGAHALTVKLYTTKNVNNGTWGGAYAEPKNEGWDWTARFGIVVDRQGRDSTSYLDYEKIADPGDGSFLTTTTNATYTSETGPVFTTMKFAPGTGIDLRDGIYGVPHLIGFPTVSSGSLTVKETWTVPADLLASDAGKVSVLDGALSFDEGAKIVLDFAAGRPALANGGACVVAVAKDGVNRVPAVESAFSGYRLKRSSDGTSLLLRYDRGLAIVVR